MTKETDSGSTLPVWSKRLGGGLSPLMDRFGSSIRFDIALWPQDIRAGQAYARALRDAAVITDTDLEAIHSGLDRVRQEFETGKFQVKAGDEDIHMAVERRLTELIGPVAGKLHTGRSRNDQVATDLRLWLLEAATAIDGALSALGLALAGLAEKQTELIIPGHTHLQHSTPISFGHLLMAHLWPLVRDRDRLRDCNRRARKMPLGSGAMAGSTYPIDREKLARELGFDSPTENSIDAVSDRDFCLEFMAVAALSMTHLSRLAEDLILLSTAEFGLVRPAPEFSTGSSLLPQKRNPDSLELIRGKAGRVTGDLVALLTVMKGLPSSYNKDLQEDKEALFDARRTWEDSLLVAAGVIETLEVNATAADGRIGPTMMAADLADYLVAKDIPFREAYQIVCKLVYDCEEKDRPIDKIPLNELQQYHQAFDSDVAAVFDPVGAVARRRVTGGTAPEQVRRQIERAREVLSGSP